MAIYSFSADVFTRSQGHHATAAAAYRSGSEIYDERTGKNHDYRPKRGVLHSEILTPENAPAWMHDRAQLWNGVERQEKRGDAQLARDILAALPHELSFERQQELVRTFCEKEFVSRGMIADLGIHAPDEHGDDRNTHAHIMLTMRPIEGDGFASRKAREWNDKALLEHWREAWAEHCNAALEDAGFDARIDHRSLEAQGVDRVPTEHMGKAATAYERDGILTERGDRNREAEESNRKLDQLVAELAAVDAKIAALEERRLDAAYGTAEPRIDASTEHDLAQRFGDDFADVLKKAQAGEPLPGIEEHAMQDAAPLQEDTASSGSTDFLAPPRGWRERMKAVAAHALELLHDQTSGGKTPQPQQPEPEPEAEADTPALGRWRRLVQATGRAFRGLTRHDSHDQPEENTDAEKSESGSAASWTERHAKDAAQRIGEVMRDERGSIPATNPAIVPDLSLPTSNPPAAAAKPMTAFERLAASVDASKPEPDSKPVSAFDKLAEAYQRALLRDQPNADAPEGLERYRALFNAPSEPEADDALESWERWSAHAEPEPDDDPDPEPPAPEPDYGPEL